VTAIGHAATLARFELRRVRGFAMDVDRSLRVRVREGRLVQVLLNLLVNAAQATRTDHPHEVSVIARRSDDGGCSILVRDTGAGMRADMLARVFEPFFTSKPAGQGTGLGLPISRTLVEEMDGRLSIESVFDVGTTVRIELPLVEG